MLFQCHSAAEKRRHPGGRAEAISYLAGIDNLLAMTVHTGAMARTYYAIKDHLGSVQALVDANGNTIEQYRFDAWGRTTVYDGVGQPLAQSAIGNRYVWQGREISWATGLYSFRARWYDPVTGRWLSSDPIGISGGLNQSVFCEDNPITYLDPYGLDAYLVRGNDHGSWLNQQLHLSIMVDMFDAHGNVVGRRAFSYGDDYLSGKVYESTYTGGQVLDTLVVSRAATEQITDVLKMMAYGSEMNGADPHPLRGFYDLQWNCVTWSAVMFNTLRFIYSPSASCRCR